MQKSFLLAILLVVAVRVDAATVTASYDHQARTWTCDGQSSKAPCVITLRPGDTVDVVVVNTLPGLFSIDISQELKEPEGLSSALAGKIGIPVEQKSAGGGAGPAIGAIPNPQEAFNALLRSVREFRSAVLSDGFPRYDVDLRELTRDTANLITALQAVGFTGSAASAADILAALKAQKVSTGMSDDEFTTFWNALKSLLASAPLQPATGPSAAFTYADRDFDVNVVIKATNGILQNQPITTKVIVQRKNGWRVSTTTGLAISRLVDDHFTVQTQTTGTGDSAKSTKKAVAEERDALATPDAAMFVQVSPIGGFDNPVLRAVLPDTYSFGIGIATTNASGRTYAGLSWRLGDAAALTIGAAGGKVKRLSRNVNVDDLGTTDPEATRRDVFKVSPMIAISWRLTGK